MKYIVFAYLVALWVLIGVPHWLFTQVFIRHLTACHPDKRFSTFVWHRHTFLWGEWLVTHTVTDDLDYWDVAA